MQTILSKGNTYAHLRRPAIVNRQTLWGVLFVASVAWAISQTNLFRSEVINLGGLTLVARFLEAFTHPELSPEFLLLTLDAAMTTLAFAVGGIFLSVVFGLIGGILASETWWTSVFPQRGVRSPLNRGKAPWLIIRSGLTIPRAIHEVIWGLFFVNVIGLDPMSAILAIAIPFGAITAKVFSEILDETPSDALTALLNSGVSPLKAFVYSLLPRAFADLLSYSFYRFECAIRAAAVLGLIGAGGLGYEIFLSLQTLKYEQIWTLLFALFLLNGLADYWSSALRRKIGMNASCARDCLNFAKDESSLFARSTTNDPLVRYSIMAAILFVPLAFIYIHPDLGKLFSTRAAMQFSHVAQAAWPPNFDMLSTQGWLKNSSITISMSLMAVALAGLTAPILAFPATNTTKPVNNQLERMVKNALYIFARGFLLVARSVPAPIWALIFLFVLFPGILPGALALGVYTLGVLGRLLAEIIENLDDRPIQALEAQGAAPIQQIAYGLVPLTFPRFIAYLLVRLEEAIRATVVVGLVGAGGLGRLLIEQLSNFSYSSVFATVLVFVGLTIFVDLISSKARRDFRVS